MQRRIRRPQEVIDYRAVLFLPARHASASQKRRPSGTPSRRPSGRHDDEGTEIFVVAGGSLGPARSRRDVDTLTVRTTCTNRDLPSRLPFGNEAGDFELEGAAPIKRIVALRQAHRHPAAAAWQGTRCGA